MTLPDRPIAGVATWATIVAALVSPLDHVARATTTVSGWAAVAARAPLATLLLLALAGAAAATALPPARRLWHIASAVAGVVIARVVVATALGDAWFDPLGHGALVPNTTSGLVAGAAAVTAFTGGLVVATRRLPVSVVVGVAIAGAISASITTNPEAALAASVVVALAVAAVVAPGLSPGAARLDAAGPGVVRHVAVGCGLTSLALAPIATRFVLDRAAERTARVDGATVTVGSVVPPAIWAALLVAAVGTLVGSTLAIGSAWRRGGSTVAALRAALLRVPLLPPLLALTLLQRVWSIVAVSTSRRDIGDPYFYHVTANLLARGRGFEEPLTWVASGGEVASALHGPAYPAALSLVSRLGGVTYVDHQWASIVLGLPQVAFAYLLARALAGRRAAVLTGLVCIVYPNLWLTDGLLYVEGLMAGFTTAATYALYRWIERPRAATIVLVGVLVGLAALTRGEALLMVPIFFGAVVLLRRSLPWRLRWTHALWGSLATVAALAPWMVYNQPRFEVFVPLSTNSNEVLFYANCDDVYSGEFIGFWSFACQTRHRETIGEPPGDQAEKALYWREQAVQYVRDHVDQVPSVLLARLGRQWEVFRPAQTIDFAFIESRDRTAVRLGQLAFYLMMPLALVGTVRLRRRGLPLLPLWSHALTVSLTALYAYGTLRFRAPWEPIMVVLASVGVVAIADHLTARWSVRREQPPLDDGTVGRRHPNA